MSSSDALTHPDAFPYITPTHTHTGAHTHTRAKPLYKKVRQCASVRQPTDLIDIADAVQRLTVDRRDPERFHVEKSQIVAALRRIAREIARHG